MTWLTLLPTLGVPCNVVVTPATGLAGMQMSLPLHAPVVLTTKLIVGLDRGLWPELGTEMLFTLPVLRTNPETLSILNELAASERGRFPHILILGRLSRLATVSVPCMFRLSSIPLHALATLTNLVLGSFNVHVTVSVLLILALRLRTSPATKYFLSGG